MENYHAIGIMSGTSLDGLDIAFCSFSLNLNKWIFNIIEAKTFDYDERLVAKLRQAHNLTAMQLMGLDAELAHLFSGWILKFISDFNVKPDFICSHGHTVFHQPLKQGKDSSVVPFTTQIGSGAIISSLTGYDVISDFRSADVALGGQGAPLVPVGDHLLFNEYDYCLNLGGIANISFLASMSNEAGSVRIASDLCYVNMALNYLASTKGVAYDHAGSLASQGKVNTELLKSLNDLEFCSQPFPKSIGKEYFEAEFRPLLDHAALSAEDKLRTFCEHIANQIMNCVNHSGLEKKVSINSLPKMLITGGGVYNDFLMELIKKNLRAEVIIPGRKIIEFKEALIFAFLGVLRIRGEINVLSSVTGAKRDSCAGAIYKGLQGVGIN